MTTQKQALLRTCASCEWIYKLIPKAVEDVSIALNDKYQRQKGECPKCGFCSYGARFVYGNKCYSYAKTQKPWRMRKMETFCNNLEQEIKDAYKQEIKTAYDFFR